MIEVDLVGEDDGLAIGVAHWGCLGVEWPARPGSLLSGPARPNKTAVKIGVPANARYRFDDDMATLPFQTRYPLRVRR